MDIWNYGLIFAALAAILWGAFGAIGQTNIQRLLAYSAINNVGVILFGLGWVEANLMESNDKD